MPKYKEININIEVSPEMIFGDILKTAAALNAKQTIKDDIKTNDTNE